MKIGVVSDTHSKEIPAQLWDDFRDVDLIIHAGDFCSVEDLNRFKAVQEVKGVYGNMDDSGIRGIFPRRQTFTIEGFSIGLFHGEGPPEKVSKVVETEFKRDGLDIIIFGHSHRPMNENVGKTLFFNPGSPNDEVFAPYKSYGLIELKNGQIIARLIKVK